MHLSKGSKTGPIISLHISSVMNVRSWFIYLIQRKRSVRTSNKVVPIKMLLHRRLLKGHGLYSSCYEVLIFLLLVSSDHKVHIYGIPTVEYRSVCPLTGTRTPPSPLPQDTISFLSLTASHLCHQDLG
jgi:hypothetical protein